MSDEVRYNARRPLLLLVGGLLLVALLALVGAFFGFVDAPGGPGPEVTVSIPPGSSVEEIASRLEQKRVVPSAIGFKVWTRFKKSGNFQAGEYALRQNMGAGQAISALEEGPRARFQRLLVREGLTLREIADAVGKLPGRSADRFFELASTGAVRSPLRPAGVATLEGLLFPDTYFVTEDDDERAILERLVTRFSEVAEEVRIVGQSTATARSPYEAVIIASLIEAEARVPEDRPLISAVIANRLKRSMKLQIDATVLYALGSHKPRLSLADLEVDSPYNTYRVDGLPPTPIAAPGEAALKAALAPAVNDYLFYVLAEANGKHAFAADEREFFRLKEEARRKGLL